MESKVGGPIGYFGLGEWWLETFTEAERQYIETTSASPTGLAALTQGQATDRSGTSGQFLTALATNFYKPHDRGIAHRMLAKAEQLAEAAGNVLDLHFAYHTTIKTSYAARDTDSAALEAAVAACEKQIALAPQAALAWGREYPEEGLPGHTGFTQLAIIREKQQNHAEAVRLSKLALEQGWAGDWEKRIARNQKKL